MKSIVETLNNSRALLITLPSSLSWEDYEKELKAVENETQVMNFKVPFIPKHTEGIERVYLVYKGNIVGWQKFVGTSDRPFKCTTTYKNWNGKFLQRTGPFHKIKPVPYKGFRGFRYIDIKSLEV